MNIFLYCIGLMATIVGASVSIWSFLDTRKKYPSKKQEEQ